MYVEHAESAHSAGMGGGRQLPFGELIAGNNDYVAARPRAKDFRDA